MTPKPTGWDELHLAENPAVELIESLGYTYVPPEDLDTERTSFKETILNGRLAAALKRLNPWLSDANVARAVKAVTRVPSASLAEANEKGCGSSSSVAQGLLRAARQELLDPSKAWWGGRRGRLADRRCCPLSVSLGVVPLVLACFVEVPVRIEVAAGS